VIVERARCRALGLWVAEGVSYLDLIIVADVVAVVAVDGGCIGGVH
jgi:hypothetical protein